MRNCQQILQSTSQSQVNIIPLVMYIKIFRISTIVFRLHHLMCVTLNQLPGLHIASCIFSSHSLSVYHCLCLCVQLYFIGIAYVEKHSQTHMGDNISVFLLHHKCPHTRTYTPLLSPLICTNPNLNHNPFHFNYQCLLFNYGCVPSHCDSSLKVYINLLAAC